MGEFSEGGAGKGEDVGVTVVETMRRPSKRSRVYV